MKKEYVKPLAEIIDFQVSDSLMDDLDLGGPDISEGTGGEFGGDWD